MRVARCGDSFLLSWTWSKLGCPLTIGGDCIVAKDDDIVNTSRTSHKRAGEMRPAAKKVAKKPAKKAAAKKAAAK